MPDLEMLTISIFAFSMPTFFYKNTLKNHASKLC
jgi:hypothetical protein